MQGAHERFLFTSWDEKKKKKKKTTNERALRTGKFVNAS